MSKGLGGKGLLSLGGIAAGFLLLGAAVAMVFIMLIPLLFGISQDQETLDAASACEPATGSESSTENNSDTGPRDQSPEEAAEESRADEEDSADVVIPNGWDEPVETAAKKAGVPKKIVAALIDKESSWDPKAVNAESGAAGLTQFMPETWSAFGTGSPLDPEASIAAMGNYMKYLMDRAAPHTDDKTEQIEMALAAYNWGEGHMERIGWNDWRDHAPAQTLDYVPTIMSGVNVQEPYECQPGATAWDGDLGDGEWTMPLPGGLFTSGYGHRNVPGLLAWQQNHVGVDISAGGGKPVVAPTDMTVVGTLKNDHCIMAKIDDDPGFVLAFCHLATLDHSAGDKLKRGDVVGPEGGMMGGNANGAAAHLHFEIYKPNCGAAADGGMNYPYDGCNIDPQPILEAKGAWPTAPSLFDTN